ncbi:response regulator [Pedobacter aquatilis]|uniref:response regulator n=1 Tax=Pedobacter aquatilis TaxID=351343 RepID=UPI0025B39873|nr:response regulator [Pedobacter aquatilis]MDN3588649.1 response regulator [Pedobacter aquatilis]
MKTIIIIDQNLGLLEILCHALKIKDYEAVGYSGHELDLYGLIQQLSPSLIIIDLSFPLDAAIRWCCRIKSLYPHLAIAAMSCNQKVFTKNKHTIFDDTIDKPFDLDTLLKLVEKHVQTTY